MDHNSCIVYVDSRLFDFWKSKPVRKTELEMLYFVNP